MKFGELGQMGDVLLDQKRNAHNEELDRSQRKLFSFKDTVAITQSDTFESTSTSSLHSVYIQLLESSIAQRKELQESLLEISANRDTGSQPDNSKANLKRVQLQINKLFIEILKNSTQLKNVKQIETIKKELYTQIDTIISTYWQILIINVYTLFIFIISLTPYTHKTITLYVS